MGYSRSRRRLSFRTAGILLALIGGACANADPDLEASRRAFREVYPAAERGEWQPVLEHRALLEDYVLWPDLRAAWLEAQLGSVSDDEVREFLETRGDLKPAHELRYRYALELAADERWPEYLEVYRRHYQDRDVAKLDCLAARAGILTGDDNMLTLARELWLVGRSQVDECNPVFEYLRGAGLLDGTLRQERFALAVEARQFSLARYLARSMDSAAYLDEANRWIAAGKEPETFLLSDAHHDHRRDDESHREQLLYALERVAWDDAPRAHEMWGIAAQAHEFHPDETARITRYIALSAAQQHRPDAFERLRNLPGAAVDERVRAWQVRAALRRLAWEDVLAAIGDMPAGQQRAPEWRYWRAAALEQMGDGEAALPLLRDLAGERGYFGFLAADELGIQYAFGHAATHEDEAIIAELAENAALIRARELFYVGLESRARSEWSEAVSRLEPAAVAQAAVLAHRWGWHSRAIATIADSGQFDDLVIRYPLPYEEHFLEFSSAANIRGSWAYGVARSESLFMADIRSHAGAIGLMQLMPATGRRAAAELDVPYEGLATLTDPASSIRLGTTYLAKMLQRFGGNIVLATAAYNAGPHKVEEWLPESGRLDARIWIDTIPYDETRAFVRRVLAADAIFHWRLTGEAAPLSAGLRDIHPAAVRAEHTVYPSGSKRTTGD